MNVSGNYIGKLTGANLNVTTDQSIILSGDSASNFVIRRITVANSSGSATLAVGGLYTGAGKTGTIIVAATQIYTTLTGATKWVDLTLAAGVVNTMVSSNTIYFSLTTAQGAAMTADIYIYGDVLP